MDGPSLRDVTARARLLDIARQPRATLRVDGVVIDAVAYQLEAAARRVALEAGGVRAGDRVLCALPPGPAFVALLLAALTARWTFVPVSTTADVVTAAAALDARAVVTGDGVTFRDVRLAPTADVRFILATSGTTGAPRHLALSDANVAAVLDSHEGALALRGAVLLSVLPWHHAFGLVLELLPALAGGAELVRDPSGGRDRTSLLTTADAAAARGRAITHLHAVPYTTRLLAADTAGAGLLRGLRGGLVGGAPVDATLATALDGTALRVGYGQTEASPGICLGVPGAWHAGTLGAPLGCAVRLDADGMLAFRGHNACMGAWHAGEGLDRFAPDRWVRTGDLAASAANGGYTFLGRAAESFKLDNGRYVGPLAIEAAVRARFPWVREVVLSSADGVSLVLAMTVEGDVPPVDALRPLLGALAARPLAVVPVPEAAWVRTAKGEIDRRYPTGRGA